MLRVMVEASMDCKASTTKGSVPSREIVIPVTLVRLGAVILPPAATDTVGSESVVNSGSDNDDVASVTKVVLEAESKDERSMVPPVATSMVTR